MGEDQKEVGVPDALPADDFPAVAPHVHEGKYRYSIYLKNGDYYGVTSGARSVRELFERIFCAADAPHAVPRRAVTDLKSPVELFFYFFPEAVVQFSPQDLEGICAGWPEEDPGDDEDDEDEPDEDPRTSVLRKPKGRRF